MLVGKGACQFLVRVAGLSLAVLGMGRLGGVSGIEWLVCAVSEAGDGQRFRLLDSLGVLPFKAV